MREEFGKQSSRDTESLTPKERGKLLRRIESDGRVAESCDEGGFYSHAGMNYEEMAKSYERLGNSESAEEALKRAMENYERAMWFSDALRLAKKMEDERAEIYETLDKVRVFDDGDEELQGLFRKLNEQREFYGYKEISKETS